MSAGSLWTSDAMRAAMRAEANGVLPQTITGLSIDTRTLQSGEAYFAIKGAVHDGHDFVDAALKAGAALAVVEKAQANKFAPDAPLLVVEELDLREGLRLFEDSAGIGAFDAVLAATAHAAGADALVSADAGFSAVTNIRHVTPDANGISSLLGHDEGDQQ